MVCVIFMCIHPRVMIPGKISHLVLAGWSGELPSNWMYDGRANLILDNLIAEGKALPMVMVLPNNQVVHRNHPQHAELTI